MIRLRLIALAGLLTTYTAAINVGHAQFDTIINSPPTIIGDYGSIGSNVQLNVSDGGSVGREFRAGQPGASHEKIEVNISGGTVGDSFRAFDGSRVTISGGSVGNDFRALDGSHITIAGGSVGDVFWAFDGSQITISGGSVGDLFLTSAGTQVTISGGEFLLNGVAPAQSTVGLAHASILTGTLEDGRPFIFSPLMGDSLSSVTLAPAALPPIDASPITVNSDNAPRGLRPGESLTLEEGGVLPDRFAAVNATLDITGGVAGEAMEVAGSQVIISGGTVGDSFRAFDGSRMMISGGSVGNGFRAFNGSQVAISGGSVGHALRALDGSRLAISGGTVDSFAADTGSQLTVSGGTIGGATARDGSVLTISGGTVASRLSAERSSQVTISGGSLGGVLAVDGSQVTFSGGEFLLNGVAPEQFTVTLAPDDILSGTLEDGTPFIFSPLVDDELNGVTLAPAALPPIDPSPITVNSDNAPRGLRAGESLTLQEGGVLPDHFAAVNATLDITGGVVGEAMEVAGSQVTISGGSVGRSFRALDGSRVTISGGIFGGSLDAFAGSQVTISGGMIGEVFRALDGSQVTISGGEFLLNGVAPEQSTVTLAHADILSGTLEDGTPFIFSQLARDRVRGVTLAPASLPPIDPSPITVNSDDAPHGLRAGESLTLEEGGVLPDHFTAVNATLDISGGVVGRNAEVASSQVTISGGKVGPNFHVFGGSQVTISGGTVGPSFDVFDGSRVTISGGTVVNNFTAGTGSQVTISGGRIDVLNARDASEVTISGGEFGIRLSAASGSHVTVSGGSFADVSTGDGSQMTISGGEFLLNGIAPKQSTVALAYTDILSGTLEDGTPFIFSPLAGDLIRAVTLASATLPPIEPSPITVSSDDAPRGLRAGESLTLEEGGVLPDHFAAVNATLDITAGVAGMGTEVTGSQVTISGGSAGDSFRAFDGSRVMISGGTLANTFTVGMGSQVTIAGGSVGDSFHALDGSKVMISGGSVGRFFRAHDGSQVTISGGTIGDSFWASAGSQVTISGGTVGHSFRARDGSDVTISGGTLGNNFGADTGSQVTVSGGTLGDFWARDGSQVDLYGSEFILDGNEISDLNLGKMLAISERDTELTGQLADGTPFRFDLDAVFPFHLSPDATLTVTLVSLLNGDYDSDGTVEQADLDLVLLNWGKEQFNPYRVGWINDVPNGVVDHEELHKVLLGWGAGITTSAPSLAGVPEPASVEMLLLCVALAAARLCNTRSSREDLGQSTASY